MTEIRALFWDIGGVLATDGWDRLQRRRVITQFGLEQDDFDDRHELVVSAFETGRITLDQYLEQTVFCRACQVTPEQFKAAMFAESQANAEALVAAKEVAASGRYLMATLNNESRELNDYHIEHFGLRKIFRNFFSSCYLGLRKPDERIFRLVLDVVQVPAEQVCFIDDRALNLEAGRRVGMRTIQFRTGRQLRENLRELGIDMHPAFSAAEGR